MPLSAQLAEFDNFRKRTEKEKTAMYEIGAKSVIEKILPVVDNFERGLASISEEEKGNGFADGMQMIYKQLMTELENVFSAVCCPGLPIQRICLVCNVLVSFASSI